MLTFQLPIPALVYDNVRAAKRPTFYRERILAALGKSTTTFQKLHHIIPSSPHWINQLRLVQSGKACLSLRSYANSLSSYPDYEIVRLTVKDGVGFQILELNHFLPHDALVDFRYITRLSKIASNNGGSLQDLVNFFNEYPDAESYLIIHFTPFRYCTESII